MVHTAYCVVEQTTFVATQGESEDVIPPTPGVTWAIQQTIIQSTVGSTMAFLPVVECCSLVESGPDSLGSTPDWQPSALAASFTRSRSESEVLNPQFTYDGCSDHYLRQTMNVRWRPSRATTRLWPCRGQVCRIC